MKFLLFICLLLVISCSKKSDESNSNLVKASKVVLIFEYIPDNSKYVFTNGISTNSGFELQYLDDHLIPHLITPDPDSKADTITITSLRNIIEIRHAYRGADELSFFFLNGDTALFKYVDKRPRVIKLFSSRWADRQN